MLPAAPAVQTAGTAGIFSAILRQSWANFFGCAGKPERALNFAFVFLSKFSFLCKKRGGNFVLLYREISRDAAGRCENWKTVNFQS
jgi:hypothetical protein